MGFKFGIGNIDIRNVRKFSCAIPDPLIDRDGNIYTSVIIGTQEWLVENLKTTHYADGSPIPNITINANWAADTEGAYCWYNNDIANKPDYGALYSFHAVDKGLAYFTRGGVQEIEWKIPAVVDMNELITYAGGLDVAGGKLKAIGLDYWKSPNEGATDEYGFKALPGGYRRWDGVFQGKFEYSIFFLSTACWNFDMCYYNDNVTSCEGLPATGFSIRCMRDI